MFWWCVCVCCVCEPAVCGLMFWCALLLLSATVLDVVIARSCNLITRNWLSLLKRVRTAWFLFMCAVVSVISHIDRCVVCVVLCCTVTEGYDFHVARVDATQNAQLAQKFNGYPWPSLKLYDLYWNICFVWFKLFTHMFVCLFVCCGGVGFSFDSLMNWMNAAIPKVKFSPWNRLAINTMLMVCKIFWSLFNLMWILTSQKIYKSPQCCSFDHGTSTFKINQTHFTLSACFWLDEWMDGWMDCFCFVFFPKLAMFNTNPHYLPNFIEYQC